MRIFGPDRMVGAVRRGLKAAALAAIFGGVLAACGAETADAAPAAPAATPVLHSGRWLLDSSGHVLTLHGVNLVNKLVPYTPQALGFGDDDAAFLQANGFNVVRLGIIWGALEPQPGVFDDNYLDQIAETQQTLAGHGIWSLLDFHQDEYNEIFGGEGFPAWAVDTSGLTPLSPPDVFPYEYSADPAEKASWDSLLTDVAGPGGTGLQEYLAAAEQHVAKKFASAPMVIGYDVINEPNAGGEKNADSLLGPFELKLMNAIRSVDTAHMVFYEPQAETYELSGTALPTFDVANAGMSFHDYCFEPGSLSESAYRLVCGFLLYGAQTKAIDRSTVTGDALFQTEFGSGTPYVLQLVAQDADDNTMSWIDWAYCGCGDPTTTIRPASEEGVVMDPSQPLTGSNVNGPSLAVLVRPYPPAIAGTPKSWSYSKSSGTFRLGYSTTPPAGAVLVESATTTVFVPSLQYPNGYTVSVTGGSVVSGNGTQYLSIAADSGAASVSVTVKKK